MKGIRYFAQRSWLFFTFYQKKKRLQFKIKCRQEQIILVMFATVQTHANKEDAVCEVEESIPLGPLDKYMYR